MAIRGRTISERIRKRVLKLHEEPHLSMSAISRALDISQQTVSRILKEQKRIGEEK